MPNAHATSYTLKVELTISDPQYYEGAYDLEIDSEEYVPTSDDLKQALEECKSGYNGWDGGVGSPIKVVNESGKVIGLGKLTKASVWQNPDISPDHYQCKYQGTVKVSKAKFYKVYLINHAGPDYSFSELQKKKWSIKLTL